MSEILAIHVMDALARRDPGIQSLALPTATASGGILPGTVPLNDAMGVMGALWAALSDFYIEIDRVIETETGTRVEFTWGGTQDGTLNVPVSGMNPIPATGKQVRVRDVFAFSFVDGKISAVRVDSPLKGGIPGMLGQLGVIPA